MKNKYSDDELELFILEMQCKDENERAAKTAFEKIADLHHKFLSKAAIRFYPFTDESFRSILINNTLIRAYNKIHTFDPQNTKAGIQNNFKAWIIRIMQNLASAMLNVKTKYSEKEILTEDFALLDKVSPQTNSVMSPKIQLLREAIFTLKERAQDILMTYYRYKDGNLKLPKEQMERLKKEYSTTAVNIRQIKKRAEIKVTEYIQNHSMFSEIFQKDNTYARK